MSTADDRATPNWVVTARERETCPVTSLLRRVGDKWSPVLIRLLDERGYGFNELDRAIEGISRRMLTRTLRALVDEGFVSRTSRPGSTRVDYTLTELGRSLRGQLVLFGEWAQTQSSQHAQGSQHTRPVDPVLPRPETGSRTR